MSYHLTMVLLQHRQLSKRPVEASGQGVRICAFQTALATSVSYVKGLA